MVSKAVYPKPSKPSTFQTSAVNAGKYPKGNKLSDSHLDKKDSRCKVDETD